MELIVLASGRGSRLKKLTKNLPKCLAKIKGKPIINYTSTNFKKFKKVFLISGYKHEQLKNFNFNKNVKIIKNKKYLSTNMVHSMFCAAPYVSGDVIVTYADVIYSPKIIDKMFKFKQNHIPLNKNWLNFWRKRMPKNRIVHDAENIEIKKKHIRTIGGKITNKFPDSQYMGLIRMKKNTFFKLLQIYKKIKKPNIDMTSFLNLCINKYNIKFSFFYTKLYWFEVDTVSDYKLVNKILKIN